MFQFNSPMSWDVVQHKKKKKKIHISFEYLKLCCANKAGWSHSAEAPGSSVLERENRTATHTREDTGDQGQGKRANTSSGLSYQY